MCPRECAQGQRPIMHGFRTYRGKSPCWAMGEGFDYNISCHIIIRNSSHFPARKCSIHFVKIYISAATNLGGGHTRGLHAGSGPVTGGKPLLGTTHVVSITELVPRCQRLSVLCSCRNRVQGRPESHFLAGAKTQRLD